MEQDPVAAALRAARGGAAVDVRGTATHMQVARRRATDADAATIASAITSGAVAAEAVVAAVGDIGDAGGLSLAAACAAPPPAVPPAHLDLRDNRLTGAGVRAMVDVLKGAPGLRALILDGNAIGDAGASAAADLAAAHPGLASLSLARCDVRTDGAIAVAAAVRRAPGLVRLDLSETLLFSRGEEVIHGVAAALRGNRRLTALSLRKTPHFVDSGFAVLVDAVVDGGSLVELDVSCNKLGPPSGVALAAALRAGAPLRGVSLRACRVADEGAVALARVLADGATALQVLDIRNNDIGDEGLAALAAALASPACPLVELRVWGNRLAPGTPGGAALGAALLSGAVRAAVDCQPYEVDGAVMVGALE
jgi:hypothetical protein